MIKFFERFKRKPKAPTAPTPSPTDLAATLRKQAEQLELEARIEKAVARYGKTVTQGMPLHEAFSVIADCLEEGAPSVETVVRPNKSKKGI